MWSARSAPRTNDLEADEDPPHTWSARDEAKTLWFKSFAASCERVADVRGCACRRPAWVHGLWSGDMMIDGVPDVRATEGCGRSIFPGSPPNSGVATGILLEPAAAIS